MNKKQLYESIMRSVSIEVKKALNESDMQMSMNQDFSDYTLILENGDEIAIDEYQDMSDENPVFLKISNRELAENDNEILIALNHNHFEEEKRWRECDENMLGYRKEHFKKSPRRKKVKAMPLNGYDACREIISRENSDKLPAIKYAMQLRLIYGNTYYQGYLPTIKQLEFIVNHENEINHIFNLIGSETIKFDRMWSCTEDFNERFEDFNEHHANMICNKKIWTCGKEMFGKVLPLFKEI